RIRNFTIDAKPVVRADGDIAWIAAGWSSEATGPDGKPFKRPGRATFILARREGRWACVHSHVSLHPTHSEPPPRTLPPSCPPPTTRGPTRPAAPPPADAAHPAVEGIGVRPQPNRRLPGSGMDGRYLGRRDGRRAGAGAPLSAAARREPDRRGHGQNAPALRA